MNKTNPTMRCPCSPNTAYSDCCQPYHEGKSVVPTAETLMRSRYSAYALNRVNYLLKSWSQQTRPDKRSLKQSEPLQWRKLQIISTEKGQTSDETGIVEFIATYQDGDETKSLQEKSQFIREYGQWVYVDGSFSSK